MLVDHVGLHFYQPLSYIFTQLFSVSEIPCLTICKSSLYITDIYPLCLKYFSPESIVCLLPVPMAFLQLYKVFIIYRIKYVHFSFIASGFSSFDYTHGIPYYFVISIISFIFMSLSYLDFVYLYGT